MKFFLTLSTIALTLGFTPVEAAVRSGEAYVRQISYTRDTAYVMQAGSAYIRTGTVRLRFPLAQTRTSEPWFQTPDFVVLDIEYDLLLGYLGNANRRLLERHNRIFRDFLR